MIALLAAAAVLVAGLAGRPRLAPPRRPVGPRPADERPPAEPRHRRGRRARRPASGPDEVARWCDDLARACRTGSALATAVREVEPPPSLAAEVDRVRLALERGAPLATALDQPPPDRHAALAVTVLRTCAELGGPPSEPLDRAASVLRGRAADLAERRTHSAQARLSAVVMTWLPVVMLALLVASSAPVRAALARPSGVAVLTVGALLNVAGWRWMRHITGSLR